MTHSHLAPIEVDEVIDADQADRHAPAADRVRLIAKRLLIAYEHLQRPAAAHLAGAVPLMRRDQSIDSPVS